MSDERDEARPGTIWVCRACGRWARNRVFGEPGSGWDESCFIHAVLCFDDESLALDGRRVVKAMVIPDLKDIKLTLTIGEP